MDLEVPARSIQQRHLLTKSLLPLLSRNIALLDIANLSRRRAFVQVLHELVQRVLVALCFAGDLAVLSVAVLMRLGMTLGQHTLPSLSFFT